MALRMTIESLSVPGTTRPPRPTVRQPLNLGHLGVTATGRALERALVPPRGPTEDLLQTWEIAVCCVPEEEVHPPSTRYRSLHHHP
jgi:hypothetical protein